MTDTAAVDKEGLARLPVRPLAVLFVAAGVLAWCNSAFPGAHSPTALSLVGVAEVVVGVVAWFLPWSRYSPP